MSSHIISFYLGYDIPINNNTTIITLDEIWNYSLHDLHDIYHIIYNGYFHYPKKVYIINMHLY